MEKQIYRYLKKRFLKGKGRLAALADIALLWLFVFFLVCGAVWSSSPSLAAAAILGATAATSVLILFTAMRKHRFLQYVRNVERDTAEKLMLERLMLADAGALSEVSEKVFEKALGKCSGSPFNGGILRCDGTFCLIFRTHPDVPIDLDRMFKAARTAQSAGASRLCTLSPSAYSGDAEAFAARIKAVILGKNELLAFAPEPSQADITAALLEEATRARSLSDLKKHFLDKGKTRSYILCALTTMIWPFLFGFNIVYPIMSVFAWSLALLSQRASKNSAAPVN